MDDAAGLLAGWKVLKAAGKFTGFQINYLWLLEKADGKLVVDGHQSPKWFGYWSEGRHHWTLNDALKFPAIGTRMARKSNAPLGSTVPPLADASGYDKTRDIKKHTASVVSH